jgi:hypothetical protein
MVIENQNKGDLLVGINITIDYLKKIYVIKPN